MKRRSGVWLCLMLVGCGSVEQQRRTFPVEMASLGMAAPNDFGWAVNVTAASARVEGVRFFEGKALVTRRFRFDPYALIGGTAWAHPGHYVPGQAMGELLDTVDVDLLSADPVELGRAQAVTGEYGSVQLTLTGLRVAGAATKGGKTVPFDVAYSPAQPIEGVRFEQLVQDEAGRVRLDVKLQAWLARIDFDAAFTADGAAYNGFVRGVLDTSAYEVTWK